MAPPLPTTLALLLALALLAQHATPAAGRRFPPDAYFSPGFATMCASTPAQVRRVFLNHFVQLNRCSVPGLKAERTPATQLFFGPARIRGERAVDNVFSGFCRPRAKGGLRGLKFVPNHSFIVGNVISVRWTADAPFLAKPYPGSDAYVTCGGKMLTIVSSFDSNELEFVSAPKRM